MTTAMKTILISVSDKSGVVELAHSLVKINCEIFSIDETATLLTQHNIPHIRVSEVDVSHVDAVVVNLHPFQKYMANDKKHTLSDIIKNIDIDGPLFIRSAAKNYEHIAVVVDPGDYPEFLASLRHDANTPAFRFRLAQKAFAYTASYDAAITHYLGCINHNNEKVSEFPVTYHPTYYKINDLPHDNNSHQKAAFYSDVPNNHHASQNNWFGLGPAAIPQSILLQGEPLSFNDTIDADLAWNMLKDLDTNEPACVIVKHTTPCGIAVSYTLTDAYKTAYATDPSSASGAIIALNKGLDLNTATCIFNTQFAKVIIAPQVASEALTLLQQKPAIRLLSCPYFQPTSQIRKKQTWTLRKITGGLLVQSIDSLHHLDLKHFNKVT